MRDRPPELQRLGSFASSLSWGGKSASSAGDERREKDR